PLVRMGERLAPVRVAANAGSLEPSFFQGRNHFILLHVAHRLDALETGCLDGLELLQHRTREADRGVHDGFPELAFLRRVGSDEAGRPKSSCHESATTEFQQVAPTEEICHGPVLVDDSCWSEKTCRDNTAR